MSNIIPGPSAPVKVMKKYQSVEKAEVLAPKVHQKIEEGLSKVGKTSLQEASDEEREEILKNLDK